jgi:hypothetical protein
MADADGLLALLELEGEPAILDLVCPSTGVLAWPAIRNDVFRLLLSDRLYGTTPIIDLERRPSLLRVGTGAIRAAAHNVRRPPQRSDVLILATGAGLLPRDGRSFNQHTDYFAEALGDRAWAMEELFADAWPAATRWNHRLGFLAVDRLRVAIQMQTSISAANRTIASRLVDLVTERGRDKFGWRVDESRRAGLRAAGARRLAAYPVLARHAERLLERTAARIVLVEEGCYGHLAVFNSIAHERGVHVAEFQHGMITRGHDAYNVHPLLQASPAYRRTQPRSILTYGQWWNSQFNTPVDWRVTIGNAHRSYVLRRWRPAPVRDLVVVLGDGVETGMYLDLCRKLAASVPAPLHVAFRPHPQERARLTRFGGEPFAADTDPDLYNSFARAAVVVGEASTALFEAVGLIPRVFVWDTPKSRFYLGDHPFSRFSTPDELADLLRTAPSGTVREDIAGAIWAEDWRDRFLSYLADLRPAQLGGLA